MIKSLRYKLFYSIVIAAAIPVSAYLIIVGQVNYPLLIVNFGLFMVIAFLISGLLFKQFNSIIQNIREISNGNLQVRLNVKSNDEFGELSEVLNFTLDNLQIKNEQVLNQNQVLKIQSEEILEQRLKLQETLDELSITNDSLTQAFTAITKSESRFRQMISNNSVGISIYNFNNFLFANNAWAQLLETDIYTINSKSLDSFISEESKPTFDAYLKRRLSGIKEPERFELKINTKSGNPKWLDISEVVIDYNGELSGLITGYDVTEAKSNREYVAESELKFRQIIENMEEGFVRVDQNGLIEIINRTGSKMIGDEEMRLNLVERDFSQFFADSEQYAEIFRILKNDADYLNANVKLIGKNTDLIIAEFTLTRVTNEENEFCGFEAIFRDITPRVKFEQELRKKNRELEENKDELETQKMMMEAVNLQLEMQKRHISEQRDRSSKLNQVLLNLNQNPEIQSGQWDNALALVNKTISKALGSHCVSVWSYEFDESTGTDAIKCLDLYESESDSHSAGLYLVESDFPVYFSELKENGIVRAPDALTHEATAPFSEFFLIEDNVKSMLDIPYYGLNGIAGVVCLEQKYDIRYWNDEEVAFIKSVTDILNIAQKAYFRRIAEEEIRLQKAIIEQKSNSINESITYASYIQQAYLSTDSEISSMLEDYFIFFQPRDVVSGDYYWFSHLDGKTFLVCADCTGHGVPGAFMSLIGMESLHYIINILGITEPDLILYQMNVYIREKLKQDELPIRDGMDMSITVLDKSKNLLEFAGAKRPLVYIQNNECFYIKGDKNPIGGLQTEERFYTNHKIDISIPTSFYIFSDGYHDQAGGPYGKKFMSTAFRELLFSIAAKPMAEQKMIISDTMMKWMRQGNEDQRDDLLVIGCKV